MSAVRAWFIMFAVGLAFQAPMAFSQEWGPMQEVVWENAPDAYPGFFNPSYSQSESLLYFDTYFRHADLGPIIYITKMDTIDESGMRFWSDPEALPEPINLPNCRNVMPSISHSGDTLFFCSDRPGTRGGLDIWMSIKSDSIWNEPVNLGDSVNGPFDEFAPCYASSMGYLFFDCADSTYYYSKIYSCRSYGDNTWGAPEVLPENINIAGNYNYGAFFDGARQALYYTSADFELYIHSISRSNYTNGYWGDPVVLSDNVNGFLYPNMCNAVTTEDPSISFDGSLLFYGKQIWEPYCIDFFSYLFYSELSTYVIEERAEDFDIFDLGIYPNPSNSGFIIEVENGNQPYSLLIYDISGRLIKEYAVNQEPAIIWDGMDHNGLTVSSGVYFAIANVGGHRLIEKMVLVK